MNITLKKTLDVTPALEVYIEEKLSSISKFVEPFDREGSVELYVEVSRTTNHHRKGEEIFMAVADLRLPGKILRGEASASDIHKAIDDVRDILHMEIKKYKTKHSNLPRREK